MGRHANKGNDVAPACVRCILSTLEANKDICLYDAGVHAQRAKNDTDSGYEIASGMISNSLVHVMVILCLSGTGVDGRMIQRTTGKQLNVWTACHSEAELTQSFLLVVSKNAGQ